MEKFFTLRYYFTPLPNTDFHFTKLTFAFGLLLVAGGIAVQIYRKKYAKDSIVKKLLRPYPGLLKTYGLIALILLLIRETGIPFLSMRIFWVILILFILRSFVAFLLRFKPEYKKRLKKAQTNHKKGKYLPKKKK